MLSNVPFIMKLSSGYIYIYLCMITSRKFQIKINEVTDKGNSRNEIEHLNDEIGVAVQSWL